MLRQQSEGRPASLLVIDEGLLQQAAGMINVLLQHHDAQTAKRGHTCKLAGD